MLSRAHPHFPRWFGAWARWCVAAAAAVAVGVALVGCCAGVCGPAVIVSTLAGSADSGTADGAGAVARFNNPANLAVGPDRSIYVRDFDNNRIRRVTLAGVVTTYAGTGAADYCDFRA